MCTMKLTNLALMAWIVIVLFGKGKIMKMRSFALLGCLGVLMLSGIGVAQADATADRMQWFQDAKFGMFIHFGVEGKSGFNPVDFDAGEWVRIAKAGGMKYIVLTTKHHAGFCLWDSALTDWNVVDQTPFKRDIVKELAAACKAEGIEMGCYYSIADYHHPLYEPKYQNRPQRRTGTVPGADITKYIDFMFGQLRELCELYHPCLIWFDGGSGFRHPDNKPLLRRKKLVDMLHSYGTLSNSRLGDDDPLLVVDYLSMNDNIAPAFNLGVYFESAVTMGNSWHFSSNDNLKSPKVLLEQLINAAGNGGNYLLNIGPDHDGVIPKDMETRLKTMGDWLKKNGEAIYGTEAGPYPYEISWGTITQRKDEDSTSLYLNVVDWPNDGKFTLFGVDNDVLSASLLATGEALEYESEVDGFSGHNIITLDIPKDAPEGYVSVIRVVVLGAVSMNKTFMQLGDGKVVMGTYNATIHDLETIPNKPAKAIDMKMYTVPLKGEGIMPGRGLTVSGFQTKGQALSWDFKVYKPGTYEVVVVCHAGRNQAWNVEGRLRASVARQSVEDKLIEQKRVECAAMSLKVMDLHCVLGTVQINSAGAHTLTLEIASNFTRTQPKFRNVMLVPVQDEAIHTSGLRRPDFSWDTVPLYMHMRKSAAFTPEELEYLAGFPLITLEKTTGSATYGSSEEGSRMAAKAIKAVNPDACVLYYRNVMCNYGTYKVNEGLKDIPGAFLRARDGNTKLHRGVREVYDLSNPALRKWWVDHCVDMAQYDEIDGIFLDGNIKALEPAFLGKELGAERKQEVADGYAVMMQDLQNRVPSDKLLVANIIRARLTNSGLDYLQYFDGSYLEGIESQANGLTRLEYLTKGIAAIQQAAREGKIICMSMGLGRAALGGLRIDDSRQSLTRGANTQPRLEYCLALFLICAEKYSYVYPHDGYDVNNNRSSVWLKRFPEYDLPLGPPKGPATQDGYTYTREFEHASVFLDIEKKQGRVTWKEAAP